MQQSADKGSSKSNWSLGKPGIAMAMWTRQVSSVLGLLVRSGSMDFFVTFFFSCLEYRFAFCPIAAFYCWCLINCLKVGSHFISEYLEKLLGSAWNSRLGWIMSQCIGRAEINGTSTQNFYQFN